MVRVVAGIIALFFISTFAEAQERTASNEKRLAYLVSDLRIPFWSIMARGIASQAESLGYQLELYSAENNAKKELQLTAKALRDNVSGIIVSPTSSSSCATILKLAGKAGIPVVIADIGTDGGNYVAYISSNNRDGAYKLGKILTNALKRRGWDAGRVGIIAIPQKRTNGQERTAGFMEAMNEAHIRGAGIMQQRDFSYDETFRFSQKLIAKNPDLRALWLQGSDRYQAALDAIESAGKSGEILLLTFDAEPEFLQMIPQKKLLASAMQQPFLMGEKALIALHDHLEGKLVQKEQQLSVLAVSRDNIDEKLPLIRRNVLGQSTGGAQ